MSQEVVVENLIALLDIARDLHDTRYGINFGNLTYQERHYLINHFGQLVIMREYLTRTVSYKMYRWHGDNVLKNYGSGQVIIIARSPVEAWDKLKEQDPEAYYVLRYGCPRTVDSEEMFCLERGWSDFEVKDPIEPSVYDLEYAPVIVQWGSE